MATTYQAIATVEVGASGASSIDFSSIPTDGTYNDLKLVLSTRTTGTQVLESVRLTFNSATDRYYEILLYNAGGGTGSVSAQNSKTRLEWLLASDGTGSVSNTFSNCEIYIPNYISSVGKSISGDWVTEDNSASPWMGLTAGLWNPVTNAAISSIQVVPNAGVFSQYSSATIYGIKNS